MEHDRYFEFAGFRLDAAARQLTRSDGTQILLKSRAFDTLLVLVARRGETLAKKILLEAVWPDVIVADNNLNQAISAIRKALGDTEARNRFVVTIPGRGFCFVADVRTGGEVMRDAEQRHLAPSANPFSVADYFHAD
jgi:DNA-binding winged helix-turn-helix (wHTH) protein